MVQKAACTEPNRYYKTCSVCGELSEETIAAGEALGHADIRRTGGVSCHSAETPSAVFSVRDRTDGFASAESIRDVNGSKA